MTVDYKAMSRDKAIDTIDLLPGFAFWREGCRTFAKNVFRVMQAANGDFSGRDVLSFLRSLPLDRSYLTNPEWQAGFCYQCLKKAFEPIFPRWTLPGASATIPATELTLPKERL